MIQNRPKITPRTQWWIYLLVDPRVTSGRAQDEVRYVGFTVDVKYRLRSHVEDAQGGSRLHCHKWIRKVLSEDQVPSLKVVDTGFGSSWHETERYWIRFYREEVGAKLTNMTDGGDGTLGLFHCLETRKRMSDAHVGLRHSSESRRKISESQKGKPRPKHTEETKRKIAAASSGKVPWNVGKKLSRETCHKMSESHKGNPGFTGNHSPETRRKMSIAHARRHLEHL